MLGLWILGLGGEFLIFGCEDDFADLGEKENGDGRFQVSLVSSSI
jgi:hypothetical protein